MSKKEQTVDPQIYKLMTPDEIDAMIRQKVKDVGRMGRRQEMARLRSKIS